jgi:DNA-binding NarL/FixJ family response regulator
MTNRGHLKIPDHTISETKCTPSLLLFVADDHPLILESMTALFRHFEPVAEVAVFASLPALEVELKLRQPDLAVLDYEMPGLGSVDAVADFLVRHPNLRVSLISGTVDSRLAREVIGRGCRGYIPKSLAPSAIYHAVRLMLTDGRFIPDMLLAAVPPEPTAPATAGSAVQDDTARSGNGLTRRETETLRSLAKGLANKEIARELGIEEVTVKLHLRHGYDKLKVKNRTQAVRAVLEGALD